MVRGSWLVARGRAPPKNLHHHRNWSTVYLEYFISYRLQLTSSPPPLTSPPKLASPPQPFAVSACRRYRLGTIKLSPTHHLIVVNRLEHDSTYRQESNSHHQNFQQSQFTPVKNIELTTTISYLFTNR